MDLNTEEMVFARKIIYLDAKILVEKTMMSFVFEIDGGSIHMVITLINHDKTVLFQIIVLASEIWCLEIVLFSPVFCLVDVVTKDEYLRMFYQKF